MKAVVQRVSHAEVRVVEDGSDGVEVEELVGRISVGMLILLAALDGDGEREALRLADRIADFRFFPDDAGRMGRSVLDVGGGALVVSQFTLAADGRKGRRPSFDRALAPRSAEGLVERFVRRLRERGVPTEVGRFGARMRVASVNEGPVTFVLEETPPEPLRSPQVPT